MSSARSSVKRRFTPRGRKIIEHVARYRLTTVDVLCRAVLSGLSRGATSKVANRLCDGGYLRQYTLLHPTKYYVLGEASANWLGIDTGRAAPLGPQSLPIEYAVLVYATLGRQPRMRLTPAEVLAKCPWLEPAMAKAPHCWDEQHAVLELVRVDLGGPADHVARKCLADLNERHRLREFSRLVAQNHVRLVVITATRQKAAAVRQALERHDLFPGLPLHLPVVPQLLSLTGSISHA